MELAKSLGHVELNSKSFHGRYRGKMIDIITCDKDTGTLFTNHFVGSIYSKSTIFRRKTAVEPCPFAKRPSAKVRPEVFGPNGDGMVFGRRRPRRRR